MSVIYVFLCYVIVAVSTQTLAGPTHGKAVVCYITTWNFYGHSSGDFGLEDLEPSLCTHLVYGFAGLNKTTNSIKSLGPWEDLEGDDGKGSYKNVVELKQRHPHLKVTLAVGGWNEDSNKYSDMASKKEYRIQFITSVMIMLKKFKFDGLDLVWKYPTKRGGNPYDKENFVLLVKELSEAFKAQKYILTAALGANKDTIEKTYDLAKLSKYLDFIHIMAYDYHGTWEGVLGANAPLRGTSDDDVLSVEYTVDYMISNGASPHKLILGVPMYGRTFILINPYSRHLKFGSTLVEKSEPGFIGYNEICMEMSQTISNWNFDWHEQTLTPYLRNRNSKVITYDNGRSVAIKTKMAIDKGLGGMMVSTIATDDVRGYCNETDIFVDFITRYQQMVKNPLLEKAMGNLDLPDATQVSTGAHYVLKDNQLYLHLPQEKYPNYALTRTINDAISLSLAENSILKEIKNLGKEIQTGAVKHLNGGPKYGKVIVCYYVQWAVYRPGFGKFTLENLDPTICTHIIYAFAVLDEATNTIKSFGYVPDVEAEDGKASYQKLVAIKKKYPQLKIMLAIGGWNDGTAKYSNMAANPEYRVTFISSVLTMLEKFKFDGLDIVWKYPTERDGKPYDKENFVLLVKELSEAFKPHEYILSAALGAFKSTMESAYDLARLSHYLDLVLIMGYDYHGPWNQVVGANSPLKGNSPSDLMNIEFTVDYMLSHGVSPFKLVLGLPTSGRTFTLLNPNTTEIVFGVTATIGPGFEGPFTTEPGFISYNEICLEISNKTSQWEYHWHDKTLTPYIRNRERVIVYENGRSFALKAKMAVDKGLGGIMLWSIDTDDFLGNCDETDALIDFTKRYENMVKDPLLKKAMKNLNFLDVNQPSNKGAHYVLKDDNLELHLPQTSKYINYGLTRTLNDAISLALEEKRIEDELKAVSEENEIPQSDEGVVSGPRHGKRVVCYITSAGNTVGNQLSLEDLEPALCTHVVFLFRGQAEEIDNDLDEWHHFDTSYGKSIYKKLMALKEKYPLLKISIAIPGWNEEYQKYNSSDPQSRISFVTNLLLMLNNYKFDGVDLIWNYPTEINNNTNNQDSFVQLVKKLSDSFQSNIYTLTVTLEAGKSIMEWDDENLAKLNQYVDLIHIMAFGYHETWDKVAGANAPLKGSNSEDVMSVEFIVDYMLSHGVSPYKLVLGIPMYGRMLTLINPDVEILEFGSTPVQETSSEESDSESGFMHYNEICSEKNSGSSKWVYHWDAYTSTPYLRDGGKIISYDNGRSIVNKVKMAVDKGLGGVMIWNLHTNSSKSICNETDAFKDFSDNYERMKDDPILKKAVNNMFLPDINQDSSNTEYYVLKDNNLYLRLPECEKLNYTLMQAVNDAIYLAQEAKRLEDEMADIAIENIIEIDNYNGGSNINGSFICFLWCFYVLFKTINNNELMG